MKREECVHKKQSLVNKQRRSDGTWGEDCGCVDQALMFHIRLPDSKYLQEGQLNPKECHLLVFLRPWSVHVFPSVLHIS